MLEGISNGELSINLKYLNGFSIDKSTGVASIGGGTLLGQVNEELYNSGQRYIPHGLTFTIGIGGHTTIGGSGITSRNAGFTMDNLIGAEVVLANSSIVYASESTNSDLFFAIRGAGAGFGIVTKFIFQSLPAPATTVSYSYVWVTGNTTTSNSTARAEVLKSFQHWTTYVPIPEALSCTLTIRSTVILISGVFSGTLAQFEALKIPSYYSIVPDATTAQVYTNYHELSSDLSAEIAATGQAMPAYFYGKSLIFLNDTHMSDKAIDKFSKYVDTVPSNSSFWVVNFELAAGKIARVSNSDTAFAFRNGRYAMLSYAQTTGKVSQTTFDFLDGINTAITSGSPNAFYGQYTGYVDPRQDPKKARKAFWHENLPRLERIKAAVDSGDVFHNGQSVLPAH